MIFTVLTVKIPSFIPCCFRLRYNQKLIRSTCVYLTKNTCEGKEKNKKQKKTKPLSEPNRFSNCNEIRRIYDSQTPRFIQEICFSEHEMGEHTCLVNPSVESSSLCKCRLFFTLAVWDSPRLFCIPLCSLAAKNSKLVQQTSPNVDKA